MKLLVEINKYLNVTILVITHEHNLIKDFGKRVVEIENGKIKYDKILEVENEF